MHYGNLVKQRKMWNFNHHAVKKLWSAINSVLAVFKGFALHPLLLQCYCCVKKKNHVIPLRTLWKYTKGGKNFDL